MGGGVMRTAAKVGIAGGAAAAAKAGKGGGHFRRGAPAFATAPAAAAAEAAPLVSASNGEAPPTAAQWASSWEVDDWEFADWRDDAAAVAVTEAEVTAAGKPRLVFAPPSREEAEEATAELRDAIERVYFNEVPVEIVKEQDKELNKLAADAIIPSMPGHVVQAFTFLKSSPEAQSVVASLASDINVWDAVLKNEKVMEFYKTHQPTPVQTFPEDSATVESLEKFEDASPETVSHGELPAGSPFADFVDNAKKTVMELVDNITHFFQDMFRNPAEDQAGAGSSAEKGPTFAEMAAGGSFMALAIGVILVVLFKRHD
ncbi:uncharacterized protein LOC133894766 [Phragmites australis]|uniref:uncharacterized protein LOC133894766 n=1 Tax=Phragmites australis TaxID=29695 RepID=UPI002D79AF76|nr:uncharacterized protein LOC133894766 [Phragmites australis]